MPNGGGDGHYGGPWWDGEEWTRGSADGEWPWYSLSERAVFRDRPGFNVESPRFAYPAYYGGLEHKGHFEFRTYVRDRKTGDTLRQLHWGILIDYPTASSGRRLFFL